MKVIQLIQKRQLRGAEIFAAQLSEYLVDLGHEVMLISLFEGTADLPFSGQHFCLEANPTKRHWDWSTWKKLSDKIREFRPDIVQANAGDTLKYAAYSRFFFRWKTPLIFRNANLISGFISNTPKRIYNQFLFSQVAGVASVSALCAEDFLQTFSFSNSMVKVIPIGVLPVAAQGELPRDLRDGLEKSTFLIHIGSFVPEKNHGDLFYIFDQLRHKYADLKLVLIGEGPLKANFQAQLSNRAELIFAGSRSDVSEILPFATTLLLPSLIEGLPGVILEAMNHLVPVVTYDVGGISEVVIAGETGWLVRKGERDLMVSAVQEVLGMDMQGKLSILKRAKQLVDDQYQVASLAARFETFYKEITLEFD